MTVIAVTSSRTSPGATSLAAGLALALSADHERSLLIEADPAGGVLALRFALDVTPSLTTFGSDTRNSYSHDLVWRNTQDLRGTHVMTGPVDPRLARSWVQRVTPLFVEHLPTLGAPVVIDLGWVGENGASLELAGAADITLIVTRPEIAEVQALLFQVRQLQATGTTVGLVTVGNGPNDPQEVASIAGVPLVAVLPDDAGVAAALRGAKFAPNKFRRSLLWRTIGGLAASLVDDTVILERASDLASAFFGAEAPLVDAESTYAAAAIPAPVDTTTYAAPVGQVPAPVHTVPAVVAAPAMPMPSYPAPGYTPEPAPVANSYSVDVDGIAPAPVPTYSVEVPADPDHTVDPVRAEAFDTGDFGSTDVLFDETNRLVEQPQAELLMPTGERLQLRPDAPTFIGRNGSCEVVIDDSQVSRRHGRLSRTVTGWHYADLESSNGSVINGQPCTDVYLASGDELYIGSARLIFQTHAPATREMETA